MTAPPLVHLVDNDRQLLKAVSRLLATADIPTMSSTSAREFLSRYDPAVPGCVVLDLAMPGQDGLALQEELQRNQVPVPVVFLSGCGDVPATVRAMKGGALDFLTKPVDADALIEAVRGAIARDVAQRADARAENAMQAALDTLTPREHEILPYLVSGKLNKQIAAELGVVEKTVKVHRMHVMGKLNLRHLADLVRLAARMRIEPAARAATTPRVGPTGN